jgi:succinate dehydrogenase / fumarate reductase flavoprotein subunit
MSVQGSTPVSHIHRELGRLMLDTCGISRERGKLEAALEEIPRIRERFWSDMRVGGEPGALNQNLEYAGRVADFLELADLMCRDALVREESCGCHLREEYQTEEGEPVRNDEDFAHVSVWEHRGEDEEPVLHLEPLRFDELRPKARSYK